MQLGWQPLVDSYLTSIPDAVREANRDVFSKLIEDNRSLVLDLISWLVQPSLDFIRHDCRLFVTTSALHRVSCLLHLYSCLLDNFIDGMDSVSQTQVHIIMWYAQAGVMFVLIAVPAVATMSIPVLPGLVSGWCTRGRLQNKV